MVSTRRTARNEVKGDTDKLAALNQKPVRRATAKKSTKEESVRHETEEEKPGRRPVRSTRNRIAQTTHDSRKFPAAIETEIIPTKIALNSHTRAQTVNTRSSRKVIEKPVTRVTRKVKTCDPKVENQVELPIPDEPKITRATRAGVPKSRPLSPKKIAQVARPRTRIAAGIAGHGSQRVDAKKVAAKPRLTRRRAASDENADVTKAQAYQKEEAQIATYNASSPLLSPKKAEEHSTIERVIKIDVDDDDDDHISMSSRATTPAPSIGELSDHVEDSSSECEDDDDNDNDNNDVLEIADRDEESINGNGSEDELCGPKTPMKRSSPTTNAKYLTSIRRSVARSDRVSPIKTFIAPASMFNGAVNDSAPQSTPLADPVYKDDPTELIPEHEAEELQLELQPERRIFAVFQHPTTGQPDIPMIPNTSQMDSETFEEAVRTDVTNFDPDETILINMNYENEVEVSKSSWATLKDDDNDDSVLVQTPSKTIPNDNTEGNLDDEQDEDESQTETIPETMVWKNVQPNSRIDSVFDEDRAAMESPLRNDFLDDLGLPMDATEASTPTWDIEAVVIDGEGAANEQDIDMPNSGAVLSQQPNDFTVNLTDFIDIAALTNGSRRSGGCKTSPAKSASDVLSSVIWADSEIAVKDRKGESSDRLSSDADTALCSSVAVEVSTSPAQSPPARERNFASSTIASRRKSMPAIAVTTPTHSRMRPNTAQGMSIPRVANPFQQSWWTKGIDVPNMTPFIFGSPPSKDPHSRAMDESTTLVPTVTADLPCTPQERYPRLNLRRNNENFPKTVAGPNRFRTPSRTPIKRALSVQRSRTRPETPQTLAHRTRRFEVGFQETITSSPMTVRKSPSVSATPVAEPAERFPKLPARIDYASHLSPATTPVSDVRPGPTKWPFAEHANTIAAAARFRSPSPKVTRRPMTVRKPGTTRKVAFKVCTPQKTPLKSSVMTPGQIPMTPHPGAPLKGVLALVEVYTLEGASVSETFSAVLNRLGAKTTRTWSERVTHVVFKDGSATTLSKVRQQNKECLSSGKGNAVQCVNSRWVSDCDAHGVRLEEAEYAVDLDIVSRGSQRKRKSMEPAALHVIGGNLITDRKASFGRSSLRRSPIKFDSLPVDEAPLSGTNKASMPAQCLLGTSGEKENSATEQDSPETPAWLHPEQLIQQTAPLKKIRKLDLEGKSTKRLSSWDNVRF